MFNVSPWADVSTWPWDWLVTCSSIKGWSPVAARRHVESAIFLWAVVGISHSSLRGAHHCANALKWVSKHSRWHVLWPQKKVVSTLLAFRSSLKHSWDISASLCFLIHTGLIYSSTVSKNNHGWKLLAERRNTCFVCDSALLTPITFERGSTPKSQWKS